MIHPLIIHFAIALPVVIILFEVINLIVKRKSIGVISFLLMLLLVVVYAGAYLTGVTDGKEAAKLMSPEAKEALASHKQLGIYLVYGSLVVLLFKLISAGVKKVAARVVFLLILIGFTLIAFSEGKKGGELVYTFGANVKAVVHTDAQAAPTPSEAAPAQEAPVSAQTEVKKAEVPDRNHTVEQAAEETLEKAKASVEKAADAVKETSSAAAQEVKDTVKEKTDEVNTKVQDAVKKAVDTAPKKPANPIAPVETVPAG